MKMAPTRPQLSAITALLFLVAIPPQWSAEGARQKDEPRCVIIAPNMVTVGIPFTAYVIVYDADDVRVTLTVKDGETGVAMTDETVTTTRGVEAKMTLVLAAPPQPYDVGQYYVTLHVSTSSSAIQIPTVPRVLVNFRHGHVFIQLTKTKVHPGDWLTGRLFSVDDNLRLLKRDLRLELLDPSGRAMERGEAKLLQDGGKAYKFHLLVPTDAKPGNWRLQVQHGHKFRVSDEAAVEVTDLHLPPLVIAVTADKVILPATKVANISVSASYPLGNPVVGAARIGVEVVSEDGSSLNLGVFLPTVQLNGLGEASFSVPLSHHNFRFDDLVGGHLAVKTRIIDHTSGIMQTKDDVTSIFRTSPYVIDFTRSAPTFKPSLPYVLKAAVLDVFGNPVPNVDIEVSEEGSKETMKTDADGEIEYHKDMGNRLSALRYVLRTKSLPQETHGLLVVPRETSTSGAYLQILGKRTATINQQYAAIVKYIPTPRNPQQDYNILHYAVTSKDSIQHFRSQPMIENVVQTVSVSVDHTMAPAFHLLVFYVRRDGNIISDGVWVNVTSGACQNDIKLSGPSEVRPNDKLNMVVEGERGSFVSTQIMEQRLLLAKRSEQLTKRALATLMMVGQCKQDGGGSAEGVFYRAGLTLLTDTNIEVPARESQACRLPTFSNRRRHRRSALDPIEHRQINFASFMEVKSITLSPSGRQTLEKQLNSLTGVWHVQSMGLSETSGFCVSNILQVRARRPERHLQVVVPYQARVNEVMKVTGLFYWRYEISNVSAQLQVEEGMCSQTRSAHWSPPIHLNVTAGHQVAASWPIVPLTAQEHIVRIRVTATNAVGVFRTIIERAFVAQSAGLTRISERTFLMGIQKSTSHSAIRYSSRGNDVLRVLSEIPYRKQIKTEALTIRATVPTGALYASGKVEVRVIGEPLGHVLLDLPARGLSDMVGRHPIGCGEQSMMRIGPLVYAVQYLRQTEQLTEQLIGIKETDIPEKISKGILYMNRFRNESGAYSTWPGKDPSTWLTAYVVKVFAQASDITQANNTVSDLVCQGAQYVSRRQGSDGRFGDPLGIILSPSIAGGLEGTPAMTAYVTISLLEVQRHLPGCQQIFNLNSTLTKAVNYLATQSNLTSDPYTMSMMAYALQMAHHSKGHRLLNRLLSESVDNEGRHWKHWNIPRASLSESQRVNLIRNPVLTMEIETAAYTLLALVEAGKLDDASGVATWLTSQHRSNGRFVSTQDTVVALQALTRYRSQVTRVDLNQKVHVEEIGSSLVRTVKTQALTNDVRNLRYVFAYDIPEPGAHKDVLIRLEGEGEVRVEVVCSFNTLQGAGTCPFNLVTQAAPRRDVVGTSPCFGSMKNESTCIETCFSYDGGNQTNMGILHIGLHHLHRPNLGNIRNIVNTDDNVDDVETNDQAVIFYLKQIPSEEHCISFVVDSLSNLPVNSMPVPVHLYDYHDPERLQCERFYQPSTMMNQEKPPIETYLSEDNEFVCAEVPQPIVHDFLNGQAPRDSEALEDLMCDHETPADVYSMIVRFTSGQFTPVPHSGVIHYFLEATVVKIVKEGPTATVLASGDRVMFYVKRSWLELLESVSETLGEPHLVVGTSKRQLKASTDHGAVKLHLDQGDIYLQRVLPNTQSGKSSTRPSTRRAWRNFNKVKKLVARKNKKYLQNFNACKT